MALKNYTSQTSASSSISWIENKLTRSGAKQILKMYDIDGRVQGLAFIIPINGVGMSFKLPAQVDACEKTLKSEVRRPRADTFKRIKKQAERTAWKIVADWLDAQMAMIELSQVEFLQVFMPYLYSHAQEKTFYQISMEKGIQKLLPEAVVETKGGGEKDNFLKIRYERTPDERNSNTLKSK